MTRTLKSTLTELALETGGYWMVLLTFTLYRVRNSPCQRTNPLGLIPASIVPSLQAAAIADLEEEDLILGSELPSGFINMFGLITCPL